MWVLRLWDQKISWEFDKKYQRYLLGDGMPRLVYLSRKNTIFDYLEEISYKTN